MMRAYNNKIIPKISDSTDRMYIADVEAHSPDVFFTDEQLRNKLASYRKDKDETIRQEVVNNYGRYVVSIAKNYQGQGLPLADLVSEGFIGLLNSIEYFDIDKDTKFVTYSNMVISRQIRDALEEFNYPTKIPKNIRNEINKTRELSSRSAMEGKGVDEILDEVDIKSDKDKRIYKRYAQYMVNPQLYRGVRLDNKTHDDEDATTIGSTLAADTPTPDSGLISNDLNSELNRLFKLTLTPVETRIMKLYFGIDSKFAITSTEDVGKHVSLTGERVRQLKESGLKKLRSTACMNILREYLG